MKRLHKEEAWGVMVVGGFDYQTFGTNKDFVETAAQELQGGGSCRVRVVRVLISELPPARGKKGKK